eukprot:c18921_g1_i1.p1 GENE.c18921_g1_i1~~c18921_g1_i1.p1  ORF type:complete len:188 (-),score=52.09 c18921_g1_i1:574-1062(-)
MASGTTLSADYNLLIQHIADSVEDLELLALQLEGGLKDVLNQPDSNTKDALAAVEMFREIVQLGEEAKAQQKALAALYDDPANFTKASETFKKLNELQKQNLDEDEVVARTKQMNEKLFVRSPLSSSHFSTQPSTQQSLSPFRKSIVQTNSSCKDSTRKTMT